MWMAVGRRFEANKGITVAYYTSGMPAFSVKDLEIVEKYATKLCVAFFALASVLQPPNRNTFPHWLIATLVRLAEILFPSQDSSQTLWVLITVALWSLLWALVCSAFLWILWGIRIAVIGYPLVEWLRPVLLPFVGLAFISMGALALCKIPTVQAFAIHDPLPSLNIFWEAGLFTYGLWCLQLSNDPAEKQ